jgi:translation initiation factor IF-2
MATKSFKTMSGTTGGKTPLLEIVLKCDSVGSVEAAIAAISGISLRGAGIAVIGSGVGAVSKSDVLLAGTASGLIAGFQVGTAPGLDKVLREHRVEVRLYNVIYSLAEDLEKIAESLVQVNLPEEEITGSGKVIALFKSSRKGIIVGCRVFEGHLAIGHHFRIISDMGPVYSGTIESLHIGPNAVQKATAGQEVGIKITGFSRARVGDLVESFKPLPPRKAGEWQPSGRILRM